MKKIIKSAFFTALFFTCLNVFPQNGIFNSEQALAKSSTGARSANAGFAEEEFRKGVQAYYRGSYNDAILEFEKALSYLPTENVILEWLGNAYYRSGLEGAALAQWQTASENGWGGLLLKNKIEIVRERRISNNSYDSPIKYTESGSYPGMSSDGKRLIFSQPVSILPNNDGSMWIVAYGSNELLRMDINGLVFKRTNGPFAGFDRPMDIIRLSNGHILISEFAGDRLSEFDENGNFIKSFGSKGRGTGNLSGPQYLACDENGNIYVSDFGNARIDVFDKEGKPLFYFGGKSFGQNGFKNQTFEGLKAPTGLAYSDGTIFVADAATGAVYRFDTAGNYLGHLCLENTFIHPEAMKKWGKYLVLCDTNKIYSIDSDSGSVFENVNTGNAPSKVTCAVPDVNGNLLACDFLTNEVYVMAKMSELVGGLFVQIEKVNASAFPNVTLEVKVENRHRQAVVGLKEQNFIITENKGGVLNYKFEGAAFVNEVADITLVIDRSYESENYRKAIETSVQEIAQAMNGKGTLRIVTSGELPVQEYEGSPLEAVDFNLKNVKNPLTRKCTIDRAIRLAANGLISAEKKRAIILIGTGQLTENAFDRYGLTELTTYLNNNSIILSSVVVKEKAVSKELEYLSDHTDGNEYYVYRSEGLKNIVKDVIDMPNGVYVLSFTSSQSTNFGEKYLPVEVETYLMNRSGRDDSGYFAPLY